MSLKRPRDLELEEPKTYKLIKAIVAWGPTLSIKHHFALCVSKVTNLYALVTWLPDNYLLAVHLFKTKVISGTE